MHLAKSVLPSSRRDPTCLRSLFEACPLALIKHDGNQKCLTLIWTMLSKVPVDPTSKLIKQSLKLQLGVPYDSLIFAYH